MFNVLQGSNLPALVNKIMKGQFAPIRGPYSPLFKQESQLEGTEAEFLDVIGSKVLRVFLLAIHSHLYLGILLTPPPPPRAKVF